ncbi:MAG: hypothetical protein JXB85_09775 [Anaerolineales bacterium]|nr:hypothetical protein [Anaerolineales bacterium]
MSQKLFWLPVILILSLLFACNLPGGEVEESGAAEQSGPEPGAPLEPGPAVTQPPLGPIPDSDLILPENLEYLGAFRLPDGGDRPYTFEYGGNALAFNPDGDPNGSADGFPGSLFVTGHDRLPYDELPNGSMVAEITIPIPVATRDVYAAGQAEFLQELQDVTRGHFTGMEEIVRIGMEYLNRPETGPLLHIGWGQHIEPDPTVPTHGWFSADLSNPDFQGEWYIDGVSWYSVNDYIFEIPADWADTYIGGRYLATGRFKDGGWSGMGPVIVAYTPWVDGNGTPPPDGAYIDAVVLLQYASSFENDTLDHALVGYQHPDEWSGGAWLTTTGGQTAVLFAGAKSNGAQYWYGYVNPAGPAFPCVDGDVLDFVTCRMFDGSPCPAEDMVECADHNYARGWWTTHWDAEFLFYNPDDLARVAAGEMLPWEPQPYAFLDIDAFLYHNPEGVEPELLGTGDQQRYRIGDIAYDRAHGLLYVLENFAEGAKPVVHVWRVR